AWRSMGVLSGSVRESPLPETAVASMNCGRRLRSVVLLHAPQRRHSCDSRPHPPVAVPLEQLLGDAEEALAPLHLLPDVLRIDTRVRPEDDEVVKEVGAFAHHGVAVAIQRVDDDLECFLAELLRHLGATGMHQGGRAGCRWVIAPGR